MRKIFSTIAILLTAITIVTAENNNSMKNSLNERQKSLAAIACLEAKGDTENLTKAINEGLDNGLTISQIKEALSHLYAYTGFPRSLNALGVLQKTIDQRKANGVNDKEGKEPTPPAADYNALKQGTEIQTKLSGKEFNYTFAPATDYYLKAHLFGDIFQRDNLTYAQRELVTVSALSGMEGVKPQLKSHINGARNMGLKDDEIHSIPAVLKDKVGELEGYRAAKAIAEVYDEKFDQAKPVDFNVWPKGELNTAYAKYFIGNSYLAPTDGGKGPVNVTFEPRCRNNWHIHHKSVQVLVCVSGRGWYQEWGKKPVEMTPGSVIAIPAEVKHWHGAAKDSWFQHLTYMKDVLEGASNEWLEPVTDEVYDKLK